MLRPLCDCCGYAAAAAAVTFNTLAVDPNAPPALVPLGLPLNDRHALQQLMTADAPCDVAVCALSGATLQMWTVGDGLVRMMCQDGAYVYHALDLHQILFAVRDKVRHTTCKGPRQTLRGACYEYCSMQPHCVVHGTLTVSGVARARVPQQEAVADRTSCCGR